VIETALLLATLVLPAKTPESVKHTTGPFGNERCPAIGDVDKHPQSDPYLDALKNRDEPPASTKKMTIAALVADSHKTPEGRRDSQGWDQVSKLRAAIETKEEMGITIEGFLAGVERQEPESCNCHDPNHRDYHLWLVQKPKEKQAKSVVVELSPRLLEKHPDWPALVQTAYESGDRVRISGWRTWDQEHSEQLRDRKNKKGKVLHARRNTLWEIHPVHRIEVQQDDGSWVDIERR
jgi:hypothetical protein